MKHTNKLLKAFVALGMCLLLLVALSSSAEAQTWTQLVPSTSKPTHPLRIWTSAVYDQASNRMIIFGGKPDGSCTFVPAVNDVWVLTNANGLGGPPAWTQLLPTGGPPAGRRSHSAHYDPSSNRMIIFAGDPNCACTKFNDVWVLTNANGLTGTPQWIQVPTSGTPPPGRTEGIAFYNSASNRLIIFGGFNCSGGTLNDVWVLSNANGLGGSPVWTQLSPGSGPGVRGRFIGGYDPATNRMFVYSGYSSCCWSGVLTELWVLTNADGIGGPPAWTLLPQAGGSPGPRVYEAAHIYDQATNRFTVYGDGFSFNTDVWVLENANGLGGTPTWTLLNTSGTGPSNSTTGNAVYDPATNRMIVFSLQDVWVLTNANGITTLEVEIDIKPGSDPNSINPNSKGVIPVAILTDASFDATTVDPLSVQFGPNGATESHGKGHIEDADGDGDLDMVLHFKTQETGIQCGDTKASLTGKTTSGQDITGTDAIQTVGCSSSKAVAEGETEVSSPEGYVLYQNHPNPFNPETDIRFYLQEPNHVSISIYNIRGEEIRRLVDSPYATGEHKIRWDGKDDNGNPVSSGLYLYRFKAGSFTEMKKMTLIR